MVDKQIKNMDNERLMYYVNRFKKERADPNKYGKGGTSRWVTSTEFWGREGKKQILEELKRRKEEGRIRSSAGVSKRRSSPQGFGNLRGLGLGKPFRLKLRF